MFTCKHIKLYVLSMYSFWYVNHTSIKGFLKYTLCFLKISWNNHMAAVEHDLSDDVSCAILHS